MAQDALAAQVEIARLKFQLARYQRAEFGRSSEKLAREAERLELAIEGLEEDQAERLATAAPVVAAAIEGAAAAQKPARRPLPDHLPREDARHPAPCACPSCGGRLRRIGEDITETLDYVPGRFKVIRHIRENLLATYLNDNLRAKLLMPDGSYLRAQPEPGSIPCDSQAFFAAGHDIPPE